MKKFYFLFFLVILFQALFSQGTWTQKANFSGAGRFDAVGFSIGNKGYIGTGWDGTYLKDFWEWDQASNVWTQKADFGGGIRTDAIGFSIGTKGYIGLGSNCSSFSCLTQDFWEWDQGINIWTQRSSFPGQGREDAVAFSIGTKGYIGTGNASTGFQDFWEYDQSSDVWTQKQNISGGGRSYACGFSIGTKGYIGTGAIINSTNDFWEWDQTANTWTQKASFGGTARKAGTGFSIGTKGYIGLGDDGNPTGRNDFWEWDQITNMWIQIDSFPGTGNFESVAFSIGNKGYVGTGYGINSGTQEFWEYSNTNSINELDLEKLISVYPNPSSNGKFTVDCSAFPISSIEIYNSEVKNIYQKILNSKQETISLNESNGIYFLKIQTQSGVVVKKIILQK